MNKLIIIGNLTKDPQVGETNNGVVYARFTVAVSRRFKKDETDFIPVVTWRAIAENCGKYLKKGSKVAVSGELQFREYTPTNGGDKKQIAECIADEVQFLSPAANKEEYGFADLKPIDGDLPF